MSRNIGKTLRGEIITLVIIFAFLRGGASCPSPCSCGKWKNGKETTDCTRGEFARIPEGLPSSTQVLDLTGNNFDILYDFTFQNKSLVNLQRLFIAKCSLSQVRPSAFAQLSNLVELDLSYNKLKDIPAAAFAGSPALRQVNLRGNEITYITGNAFTHTPSIVTLDISQCEVTRVAPEAFQALSLLESLKLHDNKLKELPRKMINGLAAVHNFEVHGNPWICDCRVLPLWRLLIRLRVSHPITPACHVPTSLQGAKFDTLAEKDLACPPEILPGSRFVEGFEGENTSVACRVWGEPAPRVQWYIDNKEITNSEHGRLISLVKHKGDGDTVSNLLISETKETDSGFLRCEAINPAGRVSANFTLAVKSRPKPKGGFTSAHVAGIIAAILLLLIILVLAILFFGRRRSSTTTRTQEKQRDSSPSAVIVCASPNPVQKPPRLTELSSSNSTDPDIISHLANGYPVSSDSSSVLPGDYTRVEGDSLYPSGIWEENKTKEQILHEHFNPGYVCSDSPHHGPVHSTPSRGDSQIDPKVFGYPSDYGLPIPEAGQHDVHSQIRMSSPASNLNQLYDSRQELSLYNTDTYNSKPDLYHQRSKPHSELTAMYEAVEMGSPMKDSMPAHPNLHDSGHQDSSPGNFDDNSSRGVDLDGSESTQSTCPAGDRPWVPGSVGKPAVPMGIPVLPPLPNNSTLHRIKPRDSPDEGYQEGTEV